jgi:probable HAF family extracellular repeat protein
MPRSPLSLYSILLVLTTTAVACSGDSITVPPTNSTLRITTTTTGGSLDPDGYTVAVDGGTPQTIAVNATVTMETLAAGEHTIQLSGLAVNCTVGEANPRTVTVLGAATSDVTFAVQCTAIIAGYHVVDLGTMGGAAGYAFDINDAGQIVGFAGGGAFIRQDGVMINLGNLGGSGESMAFAINAAGQVAGRSQAATGDEDAFVWQAGNMTDIGALGGFASAEGINSAGEVAGWTVVDRQARAFLYRGGVMQPLGTLGGAESYAADISPTTQVIGYSMNPLGRFRAFSWQNGVMTSLGTLGGDESLAHAINATGQIVGQSEVHGGAIHAFLWTGRSMRDLGGPAAAYGINAAGMIVGARFINGNKFLRQPVFWENGVMTDLPTFGVEGENLAIGINGAGDIVGWSVAADFTTHATLWTRRQ